jgi:hypothetical protein
MIFKILGGALIAWAVADFGLSYMGTDVWSDWLGIQLPEVIYRYSAMIVGVIGGVIWKLRDVASAEEGAEQG